MNKCIFYFAICIGVFSLSYAFSSFASQNDFDNAFQQGLNSAASHKQQMKDGLNNFKPENTFENYNKSPIQSHYYDDVTKVATPIKEDAVRETDNNDTAQAIRKVDENLQFVDKQALANEISRVSEIQDHAYDIVHGITDEFIDCTKQQSCMTEYSEKQCEEAPESVLQYCKKKLNIDLIPH